MAFVFFELLQRVGIQVADLSLSAPPFCVAAASPQLSVGCVDIGGAPNRHSVFSRVELVDAGLALFPLVTGSTDNVDRC